MSEPKSNPAVERSTHTKSSDASVQPTAKKRRRRRKRKRDDHITAVERASNSAKESAKESAEKSVEKSDKENTKENTKERDQAKTRAKTRVNSQSGTSRSRANSRANSRSKSRTPSLPTTPEARLRLAVELIDMAVREEARGLGVLRLTPLHLNLMIGEGDGVERASSPEMMTRQVEKLKGQIQSQTRALVPTAFQRGTVYCFHRDEGISPPSPDSIFYGYDPLGRPLWTRMLPLFMSAQVPNLDRLYAQPPEATGLLMSAPIGTLPIPEATGGRVYEVLTQVVIGPLASHFGRLTAEDERHTLTAQMILAQPPEHPLQLRFNLLGLDPNDLFDAAAKSAPRAPIARARDCITAARRTARRLQEQLSQGRLPRAALIRESEALLSDLRDTLLRVLSGEPQRTRHAQRRHQSMERPTSEAWADAARAGVERLLWDNHQETIIVIGPKGRAHVFSEEGRHVTSIRLGVGEIERKLGQSRWRPLSPERASAFRAHVRARQN